ncbi:MAG: hypothetical protein H0X38_09975 [Planctomycetes bacterium]|nr:hypothetical protein [Planctomycetota bacterium]
MLRLVLITIACCVALAVLLGVVVTVGKASRERREAQTPGMAEFNTVNSAIVAYKGDDALGNDDDAKRIGTVFSRDLTAIRSAAFTAGDAHAVSMSEGHFITYCHETPGAVVIICHVPQLRKFAGDAKATLMQYAWRIAQGAVKSVAPGRSGRLYVGLRGIALYYEIWSGPLDGPAQKKQEPKVGLTEIYTVFAPPASAAKPEATPPAEPRPATAPAVAPEAAPATPEAAPPAAGGTKP